MVISPRKKMTASVYRLACLAGVFALCLLGVNAVSLRSGHAPIAASDALPKQSGAAADVNSALREPGWKVATIDAEATTSGPELQCKAAHNETAEKDLGDSDLITISQFRCNAYWDQALSSGEHYWEVTIVNASTVPAMSVGITTKEHFAAASKDDGVFGLLYDGACHLGDGVIVGDEDLTPPLTPGNKIGVRVSFTGDRLQVSFLPDGISLGIAYDVPVSKFQSVYPAVQLLDPATVRLTKLPSPPSPTLLTKRPNDFTGQYRYLEENGPTMPGLHMTVYSVQGKPDIPQEPETKVLSAWAVMFSDTLEAEAVIGQLQTKDGKKQWKLLSWQVDNFSDIPADDSPISEAFKKIADDLRAETDRLQNFLIQLSDVKLENGNTLILLGEKDAAMKAERIVAPPIKEDGIAALLGTKK